MKKSPKKSLVYILLFFCVESLFVPWRMNLLSPELQRFIGNYGLHGMGTFGMTLLLGVEADFYPYFFKFRPKRRLLFLGIMTVGVMVLATLNEFFQYLDSTRVVDAYDVLAQVVGCLIALVCILVVGPIWQSKHVQ